MDYASVSIFFILFHFVNENKNLNIKLFQIIQNSTKN